MIALVIGGARSGKSRYAAKVARELTDSPVLLATSRVWDDDHAARIEKHKAERGAEWTTIEDPLVLAHADLTGRVVVIDCVTLWLTNLFEGAGWDHVRALDIAQAELERLTKVDARFILVSNELGMAPHAETPVGRKFVDAQGFLNQSIAERAVAVTLTVAGLPLPIHGGDMRTRLTVETP